MTLCKGLWLFLIISLLLLPGCSGGGGGGGDVSTTSITGTVTVNGVNVASGTVILINSSGANIASATITGGSYTFANVVPGSYRVLYLYNGNSFYSPEAGSYNSVSLSGTNIFDIEVVVPVAPPSP